MKVRVKFRMRRLRHPGEETSVCVFDLEDGDARALLRLSGVKPELRHRVASRLDAEARARGYDWAEIMKTEEAKGK